MCVIPSMANADRHAAESASRVPPYVNESALRALPGLRHLTRFAVENRSLYPSYATLLVLIHGQLSASCQHLFSR